MGKNKKRYSKDGLVSKVLKISPKLIIEDEFGKYIPYCSYRFHKGIVKDISVCESRNCCHYQKYRLQSEKQDKWKNLISNYAKEYYNKFF